VLVGYIVAIDDVLKYVNSMIEHPRVLRKLKASLESEHIDAIKETGNCRITNACTKQFSTFNKKIDFKVERLQIAILKVKYGCFQVCFKESIQALLSLLKLDMQADLSLIK
jgi:hypothetical protein